MKSDDAQTAIPGRITHVYHASPTWSAGVLLTPNGGESIKFSGAIAAEKGADVILHGKWVNDKKWGKQFKVKGHAPSSAVLTPSGIASLIANAKELAHIGPVRAEKLACAFADDWEEALAHRREEMAATSGAPISAINALAAWWAERGNLAATLTWLASFGLTDWQINKVVGALGNSAKTVLSADPYVISGIIPAFGFVRLDKIARAMGQQKNGRSRIRAGLHHLLNEHMDSGHTLTPADTLVAECEALLVMDDMDAREQIAAVLKEMAGAPDSPIGMDSTSWGTLAYTRAARNAETGIASALRALVSENPHWVGRVDAVMDTLKSLDPRALTQGQERAAHLALTHGCVVITGGAGTGKSHLISLIAQTYKASGKSVTLCAPTGKAARRMEQLGAGEAKTIHRMLGYNGNDWTAPTPIPTDLLIVDEVSMVDVFLAHRLLTSIDPTRTAVILVGDHNQLPPVGPGAFLRDVIAHTLCPVARLDKVMRQAGELKTNCVAVLSGIVADTSRNAEHPHPWYRAKGLSSLESVVDAVQALYSGRLASMGYDPWGGAVQLLTPTHKGEAGTHALNGLIQRLRLESAGQPAPPPAPWGTRHTFYMGDRVVQTVNDYDNGIMNGELGRVFRVDEGWHDAGSGVRGNSKRAKITVDWENGVTTTQQLKSCNISLAYALSVHKVQGSEFPCVIFVCHKAHSFMTHRNLFYTAVTRAQRTVILLGDPWGVKAAAGKVVVNQRRTWLGNIKHIDQ